MIDFARELRCLSSEPGGFPEFEPSSFVVPLDVRCPGDAKMVIDRVQSLLGLVIRHRLENPPDDEDEPGPFEVDRAYWAAVLPPWFAERTPFEDAAHPQEGWTVEGWLYWFLSAHEDRAWRWVSAAVHSPARAEVVIEVADLPLPWDALRWALLAAGATSVDL